MDWGDVMKRWLVVVILIIAIVIFLVNVTSARYVETSTVQVNFHSTSSATDTK